MCEQCSKKQREAANTIRGGWLATFAFISHVFTFDSKTKNNFPFFIFNIEEKVVQSYFYHVNFKIS